MRIVMIGNCQIEALLGLYSRFTQKSRGQAITYIRSYEEISPTDRELIASADVIVEQVQDFRPKGDIAGIATTAERIGVPVVHGGFLWPFAGQPHPNNPSPPYRGAGPYGSESSDGYLNRLIKKKMDPDAALATYRELDVNKTVNLDRLLELSLERQRARDELTGFLIAPLIEAHFRQEQLFLTPYHPNVRIAMSLAAQFFAKMGVDPADTERMRRAIRVTPFPKEELPVHPAVVRHFGLAWAGPERRYRFLEEGFFTFDDFVTRYVACTWNQALDEGLYEARNGEWPRAYALLTSALPHSPGSAQGRATLGHVLERLGRGLEALPVIGEAIALDPHNPAFRLQLALLLAQAGAADAGEREMRLAAALDPFNPHYPGMLANRLSRDGAYEEAACVAAHGLSLSPYAANLHRELAHARARMGEPGAAVRSFQRAAELAPDDAGIWAALAGELERAGRTVAALEAIKAGLAHRPDDAGLKSHLMALALRNGQASEATYWQNLVEAEYLNPEPFAAVLHGLVKAGNLAEAEHAAKLAIDRFPQVTSFRVELANIFERRGELAAALHEITLASAAEPESVFLLNLQSDLLTRLGHVAEAEHCLRAAAAVAPDNAHVLGQLGHLLSVQQRHDEAIAMRAKASALEPENAHRRVQLGHTLLAAGDIAAAEREICVAISMAPDIASFHSDLAHTLSHAGRLAEAISAVRRAIVLEPQTARFHTQHAALLETSEAWDEAETAYRAALAGVPTDVHTLSLFSKFLARRGRAIEARELAATALQADPGQRLVDAQLRSIAAAE